MRLNIKKDKLVDTLVADYLARGGVVRVVESANVTRTLRRQLSLCSRHVGKHNRLGQRV